MPRELALLGFLGLLADAYEGVLVVGVEVVAEAGYLELAQHLRVLGVAEVDGEEGVHLLEGDQVASVAHEPGAVYLLPGGKPLQRANRVEGFVEDVDVVAYAASAPAAAGGGYPEVSVVLVHAELVEDVAGDGAVGPEGDAAVADAYLGDDAALAPVVADDVEVLHADVEAGPRVEEEGLGRHLRLGVLHVERGDGVVAEPAPGDVGVPDVLGLDDAPRLALPYGGEHHGVLVDVRGVGDYEVDVVADEAAVEVQAVYGERPLQLRR